MTARIPSTFCLHYIWFCTLGGRVYAADPLSTWNDGPNKQAIVDFVKKTTDLPVPDFCSSGGI